MNKRRNFRNNGTTRLEYDGESREYAKMYATHQQQQCAQYDLYLRDSTKEALKQWSGIDRLMSVNEGKSAGRSRTPLAVPVHGGAF